MMAKAQRLLPIKMVNYYCLNPMSISESTEHKRKRVHSPTYCKVKGALFGVPSTNSSWGHCNSQVAFLFQTN